MTNRQQLLEMQNGSDGIAAMESQIQNLLESLLELGICELDPREASLNGAEDNGAVQAQATCILLP